MPTDYTVAPLGGGLPRVACNAIVGWRASQRFLHGLYLLKN
jgi:hypothetical protein